MVAAGGAPSPETREALETLCRTYWVPLYAFARRSGRDADAAQDAVQAFLAHLIEKHAVAAADPARGRFRAFLLASFRNHMRNERARDAALKRGGGVAPLSLDTAAAESRLRIDPAHRATAERLFERDWALTLLDRVLGRVREGYAARGKADVFDALKDTLTGGGDYAARAKALGMTEGALKVAAHRLRDRYRLALREEVGQTLSDDADVDDEIRTLFRALEAV